MLKWLGMPEKISFLTSDKVEIVGSLVRAEGAKGAAVLLHMMPATKESWAPFASALSARGLSSLAIDLRGHGESVRQEDRTLDYRAFGEEEQRAKRLDVEAAVARLAQEGIGPDRLVLAGASIGANLAIRHAADQQAIRACLALSPGLDYRGVTTEDAVGRLHEGQGLFLAGSEEDAYSFASVETLARAAERLHPVVRRLKGAGHGTAMLERDPGLLREAADWLAARLV